MLSNPARDDHNLGKPRKLLPIQGYAALKTECTVDVLLIQDMGGRCEGLPRLSFSLSLATATWHQLTPGHL